MRDLERLLKPRSIVAIGGAWAQNVVEQCLKAGFEGHIWPVSPTRAEMHGVPCFASLSDLPAAPDAAFIGVNRTLTPGVAAELATMGAGGAVCFASGFRETEDGAALEEALVQAAGAMPVLGPNCYGLINYLDGAVLWPDQHGGRRTTRGVAVITQSSNLAINISMQRRGLPLALLATIGNQAQTGIAELGLAALADPRVTALGLHLEGVGDLGAFERLAARARALQKPIVALKGGRSALGRSAAATHTAALAGGSAGADALFERLGVGVVATPAALIECLKILHQGGPIAGPTVSAMISSGGEAGLMADIGSTLPNIQYRPVSPPAAARAGAAAGARVTVANPFDYHTYCWGDRARMAEVFGAILGDGYDFSILFLDFPREDRCSAAAWEPALEAFDDAIRATGARAALGVVLAENLPEARAEAAFAIGAAPLAGIETALQAVDAAIALGASWARLAREGAPAPVARPAQGLGRLVTLDEDAAKAALERFGLATPRRATAASPAEVEEAAAAVGFPVAVKGRGLAHKTEAGAVALGLGSGAAARAAAEAMAARGAAPGGFLVERMAERPVAELLVGVARDPAHGLVLTLGAGGVAAELWADVAHVLLPSTRGAVDAALSTLKVAKLLEGWRGAPAAARAPILDAVEAVARYAVAEARRLESVEVNPLLAGVESAVAVDALIALYEEDAAPGGVAANALETTA